MPGLDKMCTGRIKGFRLQTKLTVQVAHVPLSVRGIGCEVVNDG